MKITIDLDEFEKRLKLELKEGDDVYVPLNAVIMALKLSEVSENVDKKSVS